TPLDNELTTKNVLLSLISQAKKSILITSPYLIIDNELLTVLKLAAKSNIKVQIIIPQIPDKKLILMVSESYVPELIESGVEIYRYQPGFIHAKMTIVDEEKALIGSTNLDFRSLYLHFENSIYMENDPSIAEMVAFFEKTVSNSVLDSELKRRNIFYRIIQALLRGFSPLL
ncbi:MAG: phospholipase D-like domain-containing protein, partial [Acholeplasmataceae bacterium]